MKKIKIKNRLIGEGQPTFIIAEAGVNHNGKVALAKKLVDAAKDARADAVKFQTFKAEGVVTDGVEIADYARRNIGKKIRQLEMIKSFELKYKDFELLKDYCNQKEIIFLSTPHSFDAIDFLEHLVPAYKFGSGDITNIPALRHTAKKGKPIILGTGMSTLDEVKYAVNVIKSEGNNQIIALHCTTNYPCPIEEANLRAIITMQRELECLVGYSDHTLGLSVPVIAAALGAVVIEKHITIDKTLPGPDHKASLEPNELKEMIKAIREVERALGNGTKKPTTAEKNTMHIVRKSIVAQQDIAKGTILTNEMLAIKRPGTGMDPEYLDKIIGKKAARSIAKDEVIQPEMIE